MAIVNRLFLEGIKQNSHSQRLLCNQKEAQTWLNCHYKFISSGNIIILSVSFDDFLHVRFEVAEQQMWNYAYDEKN